LLAKPSPRIPSQSTSSKIGTFTLSANPIVWPSTETPSLATTKFTYAGDSLSVAMDALNACATPAITPNFGNESIVFELLNVKN
jgi:hypothetical protein